MQGTPCSGSRSMSMTRSAPRVTTSCTMATRRASTAAARLARLARRRAVPTGSKTATRRASTAVARTAPRASCARAQSLASSAICPFSAPSRPRPPQRNRRSCSRCTAPDSATRAMAACDSTHLAAPLVAPSWAPMASPGRLSPRCSVRARCAARRRARRSPAATRCKSRSIYATTRLQSRRAARPPRVRAACRWLSCPRRSTPASPSPRSSAATRTRATLCRAGCASVSSRMPSRSSRYVRAGASSRPALRAVRPLPRGVPSGAAPCSPLRTRARPRSLEEEEEGAGCRR